MQEQLDKAFREWHLEKFGTEPEHGTFSEFFEGGYKAGQAAMQEENRKLKRALVWCSGSNDFGEGGQAREGWLKLCAPLLGEESRA